MTTSQSISMMGDGIRRRSGLDADQITSQLWLGSMPSSRSVVHNLAEVHRVSALVSVQTDADLLTLGFDWPQMKTLLRQGGIHHVRRVPITDFDEPTLVRKLPEAVDAVHELIDIEGRNTFLHCTAGLNRSPTVAIAYLMTHHGLKLEQAWDQVQEHRQVMPHWSALERWLERSGRGR